MHVLFCSDDIAYTTTTTRHTSCQVAEYAEAAKAFAQAGRDAAAVWVALYGEAAPELNTASSGGDPSLQTILYHGWAVVAALAVQDTTLVAAFAGSAGGAGAIGGHAGGHAAAAGSALAPQHGDWSIIEGLGKAAHLNGKLALVV